MEPLAALKRLDRVSREQRRSAIEDSELYFHEAFQRAFPDVEGRKEFVDRGEINDRLSELLSTPSREAPGANSPDPTSAKESAIWWFRGQIDSEIRRFAILGTRCLINYHELNVARIVAVDEGSPFQAFVYMEADADQPTGIVKWTDPTIRDRVAKHGFAREEVGYYKGSYISREELDAGWADVDGEDVRLDGTAELRCRYLTPFNLLIAPQAAPVNTERPGVREKLEDLMNQILRGSAQVDPLVQFYLQLPAIR
jgi:hypothetical protein